MTVRIVDSEREKRPRGLNAQLAEEKAVALFELGPLITKIPPRVVNGSLVLVMEWRDACRVSLVIARNPRSSLTQLVSAISVMRGFW